MPCSRVRDGRCSPDDMFRLWFCDCLQLFLMKNARYKNCVPKFSQMKSDETSHNVKNLLESDFLYKCRKPPRIYLKSHFKSIATSKRWSVNGIDIFRFPNLFVKHYIIMYLKILYQIYKFNSEHFQSFSGTGLCYNFKDRLYFLQCYF